MFATSQDVLFMSLAIGFIILVIFLSVAIMYGIFILRDVSKMTQDAREVTDKVNQIVISPLRVVSSLIEHAMPFINSVKSKVEERRRHRDEDEE